MQNRFQYIALFTALTSLLIGGTIPLAGQNRAEIPNGSFHSVLPEVEGEPIEIESFYMDKTAVTNHEFLNFIQ